MRTVIVPPGAIAAGTLLLAGWISALFCAAAKRPASRKNPARKATVALAAFIFRAPYPGFQTLRLGGRTLCWRGYALVPSFARTGNDSLPHGLRGAMLVKPR